MVIKTSSIAVWALVLGMLLATVSAAFADSHTIALESYWTNAGGADLGMVRTVTQGTQATIAVHVESNDDFHLSIDLFRDIAGRWEFVRTIEDSDIPADLDDPFDDTYTVATGSLTPGTYRAEVHAMNIDGEESDVLTLHVQEAEEKVPPNRPPEIDFIPNHSISEGQERTFPVRVRDPDGDALTIQAFRENCSGGGGICWLNPLPRGVEFTVPVPNQQGRFFLRPDFDYVQHPAEQRTETIVVRAWDGEVFSFEWFTLTVNDVNRAPAAEPAEDREVNEGSTVAFTVSASDADGDAPVISARRCLLAGCAFRSFATVELPSWAQIIDFGDGTGRFAATPAYNFVQHPATSREMPVLLIADDGDSRTSTVFTLTVNDVNRAPVLSVPEDMLTIRAGETLSFTVSATDADAEDTIILGIEDMPEGAVFTDNGDGTGTFSWETSTEDAVSGNPAGAFYDATIIAEDSMGEDVSDSVSFNVAANGRPFFDPVPVDQFVAEGALLTFTVNASDPDNDRMGLWNSALPAGASFRDHADGTGTFSWTPDFTQAGIYDVSFFVEDADPGRDYEPVEARIKIIVTDVNEPPVLSVPPDFTVREGEVADFTVSAVDPEGEAVILAAAQLPEGAAFTDNGDGTGAFVWTPGFAQSGEYEILFAAFDGVHRAFEDVRITVENVNRNPRFISIDVPEVLFVGEEGTFTVVAVDPDGDELTILWSFGDGAAASGDSVTHAYAAPGRYTVTVTIDDGISGPLSKTGTVLVRAAPVIRIRGCTDPAATNFNPDATVDDDSCEYAPEITVFVIPDTLSVGEEGAFSVDATDADGDVLTFAWEFGDGASSAEEDTTHSYAAPGTYEVTVTVSDPQGNEVSRSDSVIVEEEVVVISGCTEQDAINFNPDADIDDGSCEYAPVITAFVIPGTLTVGEEGAFSVDATDADGDVLTFTWEFGDGASSAEEDTTHSYAAPGTYGVTVTVSDPQGNEVSRSGSVVVEEEVIIISGCTDPDAVNPTSGATEEDGSCEYAPVITAFVIPGTLSVGEEGAFSVDATDADGDALTFAWEFGDGASSAEEDTTHSYAAAGTYEVTVTVSDPQGNEVSRSGSVVVEEEVIVISGCTDPDAVNPTPGATEEDGSCEYAPVITLFVIPSTLSVGEEGVFNVDATDADGDALTFTWEFGDGASSAEEDTAHSYAAPGTYEVTVIVSDPQGNTDSRSGSVVVEEEVIVISGCTDESAVNHNPGADEEDGSCEYAPVITSFVIPATLTVDEEGAFTVDAADADDDALTFTWNFGDSASSTEEDTTHSYAAAGTYEVTVIVSDPQGNTDSRSGNVVVEEEVTPPEPNTAPVISAVDDAIVAEGDTLSFTVSATDADDDTITFTGRVCTLPSSILPLDCESENPLIRPLIDAFFTEDVPATASFDETTGEFTFSPGFDFVAHPALERDINFIFRASDGEDFSAWELATVTVTDVNRDPVIEDVTLPIGLTAGEMGAFSATATDADGDALAVAWSFGDGTAAEAGAELSHIYNSAGTFTLIITATDGFGGIDTETRTITVGAAEVPGCTNRDATNFNPDATVDDESCILPPPVPPVRGCTDATADNFNPAATVDDGSCIFPEEGQRLSLMSVRSSKEEAAPGEYIAFTIGVRNTGAEKLDEVQAKVFIYELGAAGASTEFTLQPEQSRTKDVFLQVPHNAEPGTYLVKVTAGNQRLHDTAFRQLVISR